MRKKALQFWLSDDQKFYKHSFSGLFLLCIQLEASELLLVELHEGIVKATQEAGLCFTEPSLRDIGGRTCRRKRKSM